MSRIFITGSADGLGKMAAQLLVAEGHEVILHARNEQRAEQAMAATPGATTAIAGDLASIKETIQVAKQVNANGKIDAVIYNAAIGYRESGRIETVDGLSQLFAINSLAPYILSCLIKPPKRLVYISSGLHRQGDASLEDLNWEKRRWSGMNAYADSKLHNVILAFAIARKWTTVFSNAIEPGWVATKMGGQGAPDSLEEGPKTQAWLAGSNDPAVMVSGKYFYHQQLRAAAPAANDPALQEKFLEACHGFSGIILP